MNYKVTQLQEGLKTAFLDGSYSSNLAFRPQFISNNYKKGKKVLSSIEDELLKCEEFSISVAFITMSGITPLLQTLKELENKGIPGKILTTDYLEFSEPEALEKLYSLSNLEVKMFLTRGKDIGFHTKGYIFKKDEIYRIIVGSSNITLSALTKNQEWNTKVISTEQGQYAEDILNDFHYLWNSENSLDFNDFIEDYKNRYEIIKRQKELALKEQVPSIEAYTLKPNSMQVGFITNIKKLYQEGQNKALLISATGTGKTYASAFAMREMGFKKVLFLVHRKQIAKQAIKSYRKVMGGKVSMGLVCGNYSEYNGDYIFATVQTMSKKECLATFNPDHFDAIIYDEAHHTSAESYKKIMDYFTPQFSLGMTATPDKRDDNIDGRNIYEIFNYQIAYEIRLQNAMEEDLLCPFHYFGITDISVITDNGKTREESLHNFKNLTSDERVLNVIKNARYYGYSGDRVKGLIFCSRIEEAKELSRKFNSYGLRTMALSGNDSDEIRREAIERLAGDDGKNALDYILSVDIFSEGVDVPEINQVIMLRPTESPIVFVQQLGRGLRKSYGKEYVVVLDFIGNYTNNFMIPIALSGDRTYNKDNVRRYVNEGSRIIPGSSTIHFDQVSKKRIFQSIDNANFSDIKLIKENYTNLKNKLGHIPSLLDFDKYGEMDVLHIFENSSLGSYYKFLMKYEKEYKIRLSEDEEKVIEFISKKLSNGKRIHELQLLNRMLKYEHNLLGALEETLETQYKISMDSNCAQNVVNIMTNEFPTGAGKKTYSQCIFIKQDKQSISSDTNGHRYKMYAEKLFGSPEDYSVSDTFAMMISNNDFRHIVEELIEFGISRYKKNYSSTYQDTSFVLYEKYTYEDACRLLGWENNQVPLNIGGYKYDIKTKTFPVFINYDKTDDISDSIKYQDHFTSERSLIAISKSGRTVESEDVQNFIHAKERGIDVQLFVRKNKDDKISKEFYYLGRMTASGWKKQFTMPNTNKTAVEIEWILDTPVREDIYEYIVNTKIAE